MGTVVSIRRVALAAVCAFCAAATGAKVWSQPASPASLQGPSAAGEQRDELYRQLREQAKVVEAQAAVVKTVAKLVGPSVVHVAAETTRRQSLQMGRGSFIEESGSGVIIVWKNKYYVLTNRHVIRDAPREEIKISLSDGRRLYPQKVWEDADTDVAVMALPDSATDLAAAPVGNSDLLEIGDFVLAVGSPFGLSHSMTYGIISAKGRRDLQLGEGAVRFQDFLQTDAAINPGNSGGPLINLRGEVIGINTAIASNSGGNEGIGFSIPINMFMTVARQLIERGVVTRAFMGVNLDNRFGPTMAADLGMKRPTGALVNGVTPESPAATAKILVGDVILKFDGTRVEDDSHLINLVGMTEVGRRVAVEVFRKGQLVEMTVEVGDRAKFYPPNNPR